MDDMEKIESRKQSSDVRNMADSFERYFETDLTDGNSHSNNINTTTKEHKCDEDLSSLAKSNDIFIHLRNEISQLKEDLRNKECELVSSRSRNYELTKKIEKLNSENIALRTSKRHSINTATKTSIDKTLSDDDEDDDDDENDDLSESTDLEPGDDTPKRRRKKVKKKGKRRKGKKCHHKPKNDVIVDSISVYPVKKHARIPGKEHLSFDADRFYTELASIFPKMRLAAIIDVENKFLKADQNDDGTIDADELEKMLTTSETMFTRKQVLEVIKEFDKDDTGTLDFVEALSVMDLMERNMNTKVHPNLKKQKSTICVIQ